MTRPIEFRIRTPLASITSSATDANSKYVGIDPINFQLILKDTATVDTAWMFVQADISQTNPPMNDIRFIFKNLTRRYLYNVHHRKYVYFPACMQQGAVYVRDLILPFTDYHVHLEDGRAFEPGAIPAAPAAVTGVPPPGITQPGTTGKIYASKCPNIMFSLSNPGNEISIVPSGLDFQTNTGRWWFSYNPLL
jgi:hypothetical protein